MTLKKAYYGDYENILRKRKVVSTVVCVVILLTVTALIVSKPLFQTQKLDGSNNRIKINSTQTDFEIPLYSGNVYEEVNDNIPFFTDDEMTVSAFGTYSALDKLGRCGVAYACLGMETMPSEERGAIGMIKPSGWHTIRYDDLIEDKYLYNRCHLIAYMLSGENANEKNLITGTRYFNVAGMLPFEVSVANYIQQTQNHVMYRVTPCFEGQNLLATGVLIEAKSVEDYGTGVSFNVFVFNVQPGIVIDYLTGNSEREQ